MNVDVIRKAVDVAPKDMNMDDWVCGSMACIAGTCLIQHGFKAREIKLMPFSGEQSPSALAGELMGIDAERRRRLFMLDLWPREFVIDDGEQCFVMSGNGKALAAGTPEYLARVKERVEHFIATEGRE